MGRKLWAALLMALLAAGLGLWWIDGVESSGGGDAGGAANAQKTANLSGDSPTGRTAAGVPEPLYERAERMFGNLYPDRQAKPVDLYSLAGEMALGEGELRAAVACLREVPTEHPRYGLAARSQEAYALIELHRLEEAESALLDFWSAASHSRNLDVRRVLDVVKRLDYVLSVMIRLEDRASFLIQVHQLGLADILDSKHLFFPNLLILNSNAGRNKVAAALEQNPDSVALQVAQARYDSMAGEFEAAIERLEQLRQRVPQERTVLAALLEAYFETGNVEAFNRLAASLPEPREHEPWLLTRMRGEYALEQEQYEAAATHFERVLEQDAANLPAQMSLARALAGQGNRQAEAEALQRAQTLSEIRVQLNSVRKDNRQALRELVEACRRAELDAAAQVFQMHADALDSTSGAAAQPPGATPPRSDRTTQETPPATPPSDTASDR